MAPARSDSRARRSTFPMFSRRSRSGCSPGRGSTPNVARLAVFPAASTSESSVSTISLIRGRRRNAPLSLRSHSMMRTMPPTLRSASSSSCSAPFPLASAAAFGSGSAGGARGEPYFFTRSLRPCAFRSSSGSSMELRAAAAMLMSCSRRVQRRPPSGVTSVRFSSFRSASFSSSRSCCATKGYDPFTSRKSGSTVRARPSRMVMVRTMVEKNGGMRKGSR
mmetsp:Transcript_26490/g.82734  ORF Transcript_26490/g.82734 Transcript_26490/m.82734 type:complete len:221 (+) Transcript_26490:403-1065(+)